MDSGKKPAGNIDEYIAQFPGDVQEKLREIRQAIREEAPEAEETISYGIPAFRQNGILVYFAAFRDHLSFFPTSSGVAAFRGELAGYHTSRGTIRFPLGTPTPLDLVRKIVRFRVREDREKVAGKGRRR